MGKKKDIHVLISQELVEFLEAGSIRQDLQALCFGRHLFQGHLLHIDKLPLHFPSNKGNYQQNPLYSAILWAHPESGSQFFSFSIYRKKERKNDHNQVSAKKMLYISQLEFDEEHLARRDTDGLLR